MECEWEWTIGEEAEATTTKHNNWRQRDPNVMWLNVNERQGERERKLCVLCEIIRWKYSKSTILSVLNGGIMDRPNRFFLHASVRVSVSVSVCVCVIFSIVLFWFNNSLAEGRRVVHTPLCVRCECVLIWRQSDN